jgi:TetR/AcrR family transcriptional repressor of nem operon
MAGRPKIFREEDALNKAIDLFWKRGYEATSTEALLQEMDLHKGSLYHAFGSKKELFSRSMDLFITTSMERITEKIKNAPTPLQGIRDFFLELATTDEETHLKGCYMGNALAELAGIDSELSGKAVAHLKRMEEFFAFYLREARRSGELQTERGVVLMARYLLNLWNGINITRRMYPERKILEPIIRMQLEVLGGE